MNTWLTVALGPAVQRRALIVAAVVGTLLALINHGDAVLGGSMTQSTWVRIGLTYVVPYSVSVFSSVQALLRMAGSDGDTPNRS